MRKILTSVVFITISCSTAAALAPLCIWKDPSGCTHTWTTIGAQDCGSFGCPNDNGEMVWAAIDCYPSKHGTCPGTYT